MTLAGARAAIVIGALLAGTPAAASAKPLWTINVAVDAALRAIDQCRARRQSVTVAIVGEEGELRILLRSDEASPHSAESARRKAYTALSFGKPTAELAGLATQHPDFAGLAQLSDVLFVGGGLPLIMGGKTIGAVGVAGANGPGFDEDCARAARDRLMGGKP